MLKSENIENIGIFILWIKHLMTVLIENIELFCLEIYD